MLYVTAPLICIFISFIVGYLGRYRKMGFWGYFFATLLLTPFFSILLLIVSDKKVSETDSKNQTKEM